MITAADKAEAQSKDQIEKLERLLDEVQKQGKETKSTAHKSFLIAVSALGVAALTLVASVLTLLFK